ncbi:hypothetical protein YC2023_091526 [Brassica napus]
MLRLKQDLQPFLHCSVRDGNRALFWYDNWTDLGPLHFLFGSSGPRALRIPLNATVVQAVRSGHWNLPLARSELAVTLQIILSTLSVPSAVNGGDVYLWRIQSGGFGPSFSSRRVEIKLWKARIEASERIFTFLSNQTTCRLSIARISDLFFS